MNEDLIAVINHVRANKKQPPLHDLTASSRLREELGFDSLDLAELTARIHERHRVDVFATGLVFTVGEVEERIRFGGRTADGGPQ